MLGPFGSLYDRLELVKVIFLGLNVTQTADIAQVEVGRQLGSLI